jgi:hypothetical protein
LIVSQYIDAVLANIDTFPPERAFPLARKARRCFERLLRQGGEEEDSEDVSSGEEEGEEEEAGDKEKGEGDRFRARFFVPSSIGTICLWYPFNFKIIHLGSC